MTFAPTFATLETLESRRLLAGITLLTHGYNGDVNGWVKTAAADVASRAGGKNAASIYTMSVAASGGKLAVTAFGPDSGQKAFTATTNAEMVLKLDWSTVSGGSYTTQAVAAVVASYMLSAHGSTPALAELSLQLIGHSRGASLVTALSQDFGQAGVWVDQVTDLDPHPVDGVNDFFGVSFGDQKMAVYDNVAFADDYWRTDGDANNSDFDGESVVGTYQGNLNSTVQKNFFVSAHAAVTAYYVGTIDTSTTDGGDHPVIPSWYNTSTTPPRTATGFAFSRLGGRSRPAAGISTLLGGKGKRSSAGEDGDQWANVFNFVSRGATSLAAGTTLTTQFLASDRDTSGRVAVYLDTNQNPYDGASLLTSKSFASSDLAGVRLNVGTTGLKAGTYYLVAKATDAQGHSRYNYSPLKITITSAVAPDFAKLVGGVLTVTGTTANDAISLAQSSSTITATLNGTTQTFSSSAVTSVVIQGDAGNDGIDASAMTTALYINGGTGFDNITGGAGNDTLSGGAQSDTLTGGAGDDVLSGNGGNNLLVGNGGYDRLYSADGSQDTMIGGSNADRFFGGSGNDSMIGGPGNDKMYANDGNDTLIGGPGIDIINGGAGIDSADNDPTDLRTDIEIILSV